MPEDHAAPEAYDTDHHWDKERRPPEELHSALGPNLEPAPKQRKVEALDDTVNPEDHDWHTAWKDVDVHKLRAAWEALREWFLSALQASRLSHEDDRTRHEAAGLGTPFETLGFHSCSWTP